MSKKRILITWDTRRLNEIIKPLIDQLSPDYSIYIVGVAYYEHRWFDVGSLLEQWQQAGLIEGYRLIPSKGTLLKNSMWDNHCQLRNLSDQLFQRTFDYWLTTSDVHVVEKYISQCGLKAQTKKIILWTGPTYIFEHKDLVYKLLNENTDQPIQSFKVAHLQETVLSKIQRCVRQSDSLGVLILSLFKGLINKIRGMFLEIKGRIFSFYFDRIIFPWILKGKTFPYESFDCLTQIGPPDFKALMFTDPLETKAYRVLYQNQQVFTVQYPSWGACTCQGKAIQSKVILCPLSGFLFCKIIPRESLELFYRDFRIVLDQTGADTIHLRHHPDGCGGWEEQMKLFLLNKGIKAQVVGCEQPIRQVACQYRAVVGFASGALRDARASCSHTSVIAFEGVSRYRYKDPKFVFASSEGLGWIDFDGQFKKEIFHQKFEMPQERQTILSVLQSLN